MKRLFQLFALLLLAIPSVVSAHAFGQSYALPLPAWMYMYAGAVVVLLSFVGVVIFSSRRTQAQRRTREIAIGTSARSIAQWIVVGIWILALLAGVYGSSAASINFLVSFFWIALLLGGVYLSAIFGNSVALLSPLRTIALFIAHDRALVSYPKKLGHTPALIAYALVILLEFSPHSMGIDPSFLAGALIGYTVYTLLGAFLFGVRDWFYYADCFSVLFRVIGKVAPFDFAHGALRLRMPFSALATEYATSFSETLLIIFLLASTMFDGLRETVTGSSFLLKLSNHAFVQIFVGLVLLFVACILVYVGIIFIMKRMLHESRSIVSLASLYAYSLVPIALAYNIAHYIGLFSIELQSFIIRLSDPLNLGWNLFGTSGMSVRPDVITAQGIWQIQLAVIVVGHVIGVYVAHRIAVVAHTSSRKVWVSQLPMLVVMILYTMLGLWILAEPLAV